MKTSCDYVIVGAGSAGCVLASRLSEDPTNRVVLLEAGGPDTHPLMRIPLGFLKLIQDQSVSWGYTSEPEPHAGGRQLWLPRGKTLGGSSSLNGMVYGRGHPLDYDEWSELGAKGWSYADVLPYFRRAETSWRGESEYHGASGPLSVTRLEPNPVLYPAVMETARALGYGVHDDHHGREAEGFAVPEGTIHRGERGSTSVCYLRPAARRSNLTVLTKAHATRVLLQNGRAIGVEFVRDGRTQQVYADREVILSGGAYNSPQLLLLSGIGPADELRALGIDPQVDLPGVGRNLQEHAALAFGYELREPVAFDAQLRFDRIATAMLRWMMFRTGPVAQLPVICMGFFRSRPGLTRPDIKTNFYPTGMDARVWFPLLRRGAGHMMTSFSMLLHPVSRGHVKLRSSDPMAAPRISLGLLSAREDVTALVSTLKLTREFFATQPLARYLKRETLPGDQVQTEAQMEAYVRSTTLVAHHPAGTCAMGSDAEAVLDAQLRVRGVEGLRVADASVMPRVIGGNTNAPVIMIAEKASDLILGRPALPLSHVAARNGGPLESRAPEPAGVL